MQYLNQTPSGLHILQIGFFSGGNCCRHKYSHVELRFSDGTVTSITRNPGRVHLIYDKQMSNPLYSGFYQISVSPVIEQQMRYYAETCTESFSSFSMYWNFLFPCTVRRWGFFCSAYICKLLHIASFCTDLDPYRTSPDDLYKELSIDERALCSYNPPKRR